MNHVRRIRDYTVHIQPDDEGGYFSTVSGLGGCTCSGRTEDECADNTEAAIDAVLDLLREQNGITEESLR